MDSKTSLNQQKEQEKFEKSSSTFCKKIKRSFRKDKVLFLKR